MANNKKEVFTRCKQEIQSGALSRQDNGGLYVFMRENEGGAEKSNLLIFDTDAVPQKSN